MVRYGHLLFSLAAGAALFAPVSFAQLPSLSTLSGAYNVRYLGVNTDPADSAVSFSGTITFDGNGKFAVSGSGASVATTDKSLKFQTTGQYFVLPSGLLQMTNPFDPNGKADLTAFPNTILYGGIGSGYIVASSTDTAYCDLFVAVQVSTSASNATLNGTYQVASMEFLNGDFTQTRGTFFNMAANGSGSLGNVTIKGTSQNANNAAQTQTATGSTYNVTANGTGTMTFPVASGQTPANTLLGGAKNLYVSRDGNFFVAGGATAYDMVVGVKRAPGVVPSGMYFSAYLENYAAGTNSDGIYSAEGASNVISGGQELAHQRINEDGFDSYDSTFYDKFAFDADATATYSDSQYAVGANGDIVISSGNGTNYQVLVYVKSLPIQTSGNFANPQGIVNAASSSPFSTSFSPGEFVTIYGTGLASSSVTATALPFPTNLGGVTVTVNGTAAPLYLVSPTQINFIIPYSAPSDGTLLEIKVSSVSNTVLVYSGPTDPGVFTYPNPGGIGNGAILHADFSVVNQANPARAGETIQIYLTGLGEVSPAVKEGTAAPSSPLSTTTNAVGVYIDGNQCTIDPNKGGFKGLAPGFAGLYQVNCTIPSGLSADDHYLEIATNYSDNYQAIIPIGR